MNWWFILGALFLAIQLFYFYFYSKLIWHKDKASESKHPISLVICAKNAKHLLQKSLPLILSQKHAEFELIIVDDYSTDGTLDYLKTTYKNQIIVLSNTDKPGKKYALKLGIQNAKHERILTTDADCRPLSSEWIATVSGQTNNDILLLYSPYNLHEGWLSKLVVFETVITAIQYFSWALRQKPYMGVARNLSYNKSTYLKSLNPNYYILPYGDDDLFIQHAALSSHIEINLDANTFVYTDPPTTWAQWISQKQRHVSTGKNYHWIHLLGLGLFPISLLGLLLTAAVAPTLIIITLVIIRYMMYSILYYGSMKKLVALKIFILFPLLEILWLIYLIIVSPFIFLINKSSWK